MEMRLIDADAFDKILIEAQSKCKKSGGNFRFGVLGKVRAVLAVFPTVDRPEIVRCKDCKHGRKHNIDIIECMKAHDYNLEHQEFHYKNWFCADGERGERAENARLSSSEIPDS